MANPTGKIASATSEAPPPGDEKALILRALQETGGNRAQARNVSNHPVEAP